MIVATAAVTVAATFKVGAAVAWIASEGIALTLAVAGLDSPPHAPRIAIRTINTTSFMGR